MPSLEWFAIRTKSNRESVVAEALSDKGYQVLFPTLVPGDGKQGRAVSKKPLFPGYLFARFDVKTRLPILITDGVAYIVSSGKIPIPVDAEEMVSLQLLIASHSRLTLEPKLPVGTPVYITYGPLAGASGQVIHDGHDRLIVSISLLQRAISVAISPEWISSASVLSGARNQLAAAGR